METASGTPQFFSAGLKAGFEVIGLEFNNLTAADSQSPTLMNAIRD
jgi:hypothetical protein